MCLEDLRLGRGRFLKLPTIATSGALVTMQPDATRVAVIVSMTLISTFDPAGPTTLVDSVVVRFAGTTSAVDSLFFGPGTSVFVMRIEDYGSVITGPISVSVNNSTGQAQVTLAAICTPVNAPPLDTYKP